MKRDKITIDKKWYLSRIDKIKELENEIDDLIEEKWLFFFKIRKCKNNIKEIKKIMRKEFKNIKAKTLLYYFLKNDDLKKKFIEVML